MQRISTNATIFFKFFIPVFWLVFFGAFLAAVFAYGAEMASGFASTGFRIGAVLFYFSGLALFYFTLFPLKRVEADNDFLYVTNYFKTFRYPWHNIESISDSTFLFFTIARVELKEKGNFGKKMSFMASRRLYQDFWKEHSELAGLRKV
ncbi:hypothetical protein [Lewinella cohaerens]|uniref:hypothetical protein n=1 Tax=Lewinella cohaerens TaxID=70995 RepID=UPI00037A987B|nr:hypothetical protein [Lewinella cohaerens]